MVDVGDIVGFADFVGFGSAAGLGAVVVGCSTVLLGDEAGVVCCVVLCEAVEADVLRCCPVLFPAPLSAWSAIWPLAYRPAAAARAHSAAVMPAAMRRRLLTSAYLPWAPPGSPSSGRSALV